MGANIVRRVMRQGHECVVYDRDPQVVPAGQVTTSVIDGLAQALQSGDTVIDGGNTYYRDDIRHAQKFGQRGIRLLDCGTSGGVWGLQRGYCLMIGGDPDVVAGAEPIFASVAPGVDTAPRTPGRTGQIAPSEQGYLRCGPTGAGHHADIGTRSQHSDAAPVLTTALYSRFASRHLDEFADQALSAMRQQFGGHQEKPLP
jgi:6-phosphogluconate dehydrogenase